MPAGGSTAGATATVAFTAALIATAMAGQWSPAANLTIPRHAHGAALLPDGRVLIMGGRNLYIKGLASSEIYDPALDAWSPTGSLHIGRSYPVTTVLQDGSVLVTAGWISDGSYTQTAERYDPTTGTWTMAGALSQTGRLGHCATLLEDGHVLSVAGQTATGVTGLADRFDPSSNRWSKDRPGPSMSGCTLTTLPSGVVLAVGSYPSRQPTTYLFDPVARTWATTTGNLTDSRDTAHTATTLVDGSVLVVGGYGREFGRLLNSSEVFDEKSGRWTLTATPMTFSRYYHTATLLADGQHVLVAGGQSADDDNRWRAVNSAEILDLRNGGSWALTAAMATQRFSHTATLLRDGRVLVVGGDPDTNEAAALASCEIFEPTGL